MKVILRFFSLSALVAVLFLSASHAQEPLIKAGEAKSRKSNLAFPELNNLSATGTAALKNSVNRLRQTAEDALKLSNYFEVMNPSAFLEDTKKVSAKPDTYEMGGFKFDSWKTIGTEYLIRGTYEQVGSELTVDIFVYQVDLKQLKLGKKYKTKMDNTERIGYLIANDILQAVIGRSY